MGPGADRRLFYMAWSIISPCSMPSYQQQNMYVSMYLEHGSFPISYVYVLRYAIFED